MSSLHFPFRRFLLTVAVVAALAPRAMAAGHTTLVSIDSSGLQGIGNSEIPAIAADGRFVAFRSTDPYLVPDDSNRQTDIFVHDRQRGKTTLVSVSSSGKQANGFSVIYPGGISGDGRVVAFPSTASNLVPGDISGWDIFVRDRRLVPDQTADLVARQTASADPVGTGEELTYTVTVHHQ